MEELDPVVLLSDIDQHGLKKGDVGTIVLVHESGQAYEVEFVTLSGATVAVLTVAGNLIRPARDREIATARSVA